MSMKYYKLFDLLAHKEMKKTDYSRQRQITYNNQEEVSAPAIYSFSDSIKANIYDDLWTDFRKLDS